MGCFTGGQAGQADPDQIGADQSHRGRERNPAEDRRRRLYDTGEPAPRLRPSAWRWRIRPAGTSQGRPAQGPGATGRHARPQSGDRRNGQGGGQASQCPGENPRPVEAEDGGRFVGQSADALAGRLIASSGRATARIRRKMDGRLAATVPGRNGAMAPYMSSLKEGRQ